METLPNVTIFYDVVEGNFNLANFGVVLGRWFRVLDCVLLEGGLRVL